MEWALGPGFGPRFPNSSNACGARNFTAAAAECWISSVGNAGVTRRNTANHSAFLLAADTLAIGGDLSILRSRVPFREE